MRKQLYRRYSVDEDTPVQFVGVYTTHWQPEWGGPEVMFAEIDDPLIDAAPQLLEALNAVWNHIKKEAGDFEAFIAEGCGRLGVYIAPHELEQIRNAIAAAKGKSR
jgi:hypothetical protein